MKYLSSVVLGLVSLGLAISSLVSNQRHNAQHETDAQAILSASNLLSKCQTELATSKERSLTLSNQIETCQSTSLSLSNELVQAKSAFAEVKQGLDRQLTDLNRQLEKQTTQSEAEKRASSHRLADLTNQITALTNQVALTRASLARANHDYELLEDRFRRDVAQRLIAERRFNNRAELKAQLDFLLWNPIMEISEDRIREGLDLVVGQSNRWYVVAPE